MLINTAYLGAQANGNGVLLSVVIPAYNEQDNLPILMEELNAALQNESFVYEVIIVNDGSTDSTKAVLQQLTSTYKALQPLHLPANKGQSTATAKGIEVARGKYIALMDGDLQNDPRDIVLLLTGMQQTGCDLACGWRINRRDKASGVYFSKVANGLIRLLFGVAIHDSGCTLKVGKAALLKSFKYFEHYHRYFPIIAHQKGAIITETPINHRARRYGVSKYTLLKTFKVAGELAFLKFRYQA